MKSMKKVIKTSHKKKDSLENAKRKSQHQEHISAPADSGSDS